MLQHLKLSKNQYLLAGVVRQGEKVLSWEQWQWWNWTGLFWRVSGRYFDSHHSVRPSLSHFCGLTDKYIGRVKICAPLYKHHGQNMRTSSCWCVVDIVHTFWGRQTRLSRFICRLFFALNTYIHYTTPFEGTKHIFAVSGLPEHCTIFHSPSSVHPSVRHRRDISTFLDNLMV